MTDISGAVLIDTDGDGQGDRYGYDTDGDGSVDHYGYDTDGDGYVDLWQPYPGAASGVDDPSTLTSTWLDGLADPATGSAPTVDPSSVDPSSWTADLSPARSDQTGNAALVTSPTGAALVESNVVTNAQVAGRTGEPAYAYTY